MPAVPHPFSMTWRYGLFAHWPVDPDRLRPHVPEPLELDVRSGAAWVSVLPFVLERAGIRGTPDAARLTTAELNLRTYVQLDGDPGLYFFSLDFESRLAGRIGGSTRLPCYRAEMTVDHGSDGIAFESERRSGEEAVRFAATYRPTGAPSRPDPDSLDHWLVERRRFYDPTGSGILWGEIAHEPWPVRAAEVTIRTNELFDAANLPKPDGEPLFRYCEILPMTGSILRRRGARRAGRTN